MNTSVATLIEQHTEKYKVFYENGVLDPVAHCRLVENAEEYAREAGIRISDIYMPFSAVCNTIHEQKYIADLVKNKKNPLAGMYYLNDMDPNIIERMRAITGAMVRNFAATRLLTQGRLFDLIIDNAELSDYKMLCLPDVMHSTISVSDGMRRSVATMIVDRYIEGNQIVMGRVGTEKNIRDRFGEDVAYIITNHYLAVG